MKLEKEIKQFTHVFNTLVPAMIKSGDKSINAAKKLNGWTIKIQLVKDDLYKGD